MPLATTGDALPTAALDTVTAVALFGESTDCSMSARSAAGRDVVGSSGNTSIDICTGVPLPRTIQESYSGGDGGLPRPGDDENDTATSPVCGC